MSGSANERTPLLAGEAKFYYLAVLKLLELLWFNTLGIDFSLSYFQHSVNYNNNYYKVFVCNVMFMIYRWE